MRHPSHLSRCFFAFLLSLLVLSFPALAMESPLTQAERDFAADGALPAACSESVLGSLAAEAVRTVCGTDLALLPAGLFSGTLEAGAVFESDLDRLFPQDTALRTAQLSPADLKNFLETGVSHLVTGEGDRIDPERSAWAGFPQTAGFAWEYDVSAPAGSRVLSIRFQGEELALDDEGTQLTLTAPAALLDGSLGYPVFSFSDAGWTLREALSRYLNSMDSISPLGISSTVIGTASYPLSDRLPIAAVAVACILIALISSIARLKYNKHFTFQRN